MPEVKITEAKIERKVVEYCRKHGLYCRKWSSPAHRGVPDRIIIGHGRVLFLELKRPGNTATALQEHEMRLIGEAGGTAACATGYEAAILIIERAVRFPGRELI